MKHFGELRSHVHNRDHLAIAAFLNKYKLQIYKDYVLGNLGYVPPQKFVTPGHKNYEALKLLYEWHLEDITFYGERDKEKTKHMRATHDDVDAFRPYILERLFEESFDHVKTPLADHVKEWFQSDTGNRNPMIRVAFFKDVASCGLSSDMQELCIGLFNRRYFRQYYYYNMPTMDIMSSLIWALGFKKKKRMGCITPETQKKHFTDRVFHRIVARELGK